MCTLAPPGIPVPFVNDMSKSTVSLSWTPPATDGGSKIKGYIVEMQEEGRIQNK